MHCIHIDRKRVNLVALDEQLREVLGDVYIGVNCTPDQIQAYLSDAATPEQCQQAKTCLNADDVRRLTPAQVEQSQQQQALQRARQGNRYLLDMSDYDYSDGIIRQLARKIAWLELEIRALRA